MNRTILRCLAALALAAPAGAASYSIDADHGTVGFRIRHLVGKVSGRFDRFEGSFEYVEGKPEAWKATAVMEASSINTANAKRDDHLRGEDFFDVAKCPKVEFVSKKATMGKGRKGKLTGELTMHCVTQPVTLDLEIGETGVDPRGNQRIGMSAAGKLNRKDFGISYNKVLDNGGLVLGEEVGLEIEIEGIQTMTDKAGDKAEKTEPKKGK